MDPSNESEISSLKKNKTKRADREIYRPGALRKLKVNTGNSGASELKKEIPKENSLHCKPPERNLAQCNSTEKINPVDENSKCSSRKSPQKKTRKKSSTPENEKHSFTDKQSNSATERMSSVGSFKENKNTNRNLNDTHFKCIDISVKPCFSGGNEDQLIISKSNQPQKDVVSKTSTTSNEDTRYKKCDTKLIKDNVPGTLIFKRSSTYSKSDGSDSFSKGSFKSEDLNKAKEESKLSLKNKHTSKTFRDKNNDLEINNAKQYLNKAKKSDIAEAATSSKMCDGRKNRSSNEYNVQPLNSEKSNSAIGKQRHYESKMQKLFNVSSKPNSNKHTNLSAEKNSSSCNFAKVEDSYSVKANQDNECLVKEFSSKVSLESKSSGVLKKTNQLKQGSKSGFKYIEDIDLGASFEEEYEDKNKESLVNPMNFIADKSNSGFISSKSSGKDKIDTNPSYQNCWSDEKWSSRRKPGYDYNISKDVQSSDKIGRRGIIEVNNSPIRFGSPPANATQSSHRLLFNPDNPSKPLTVMPSARDLPQSVKQGNESKIEEPSMSFASKEKEHPTALDQSLFYSIQKGELDITYFVNSNQLPQEFRRIMDIRQHLLLCYKKILLADIRYCQEKNIEGALWKSLYYIIIEKLREYIAKEPSLKERSLSSLMMIVEEGLSYFQGILIDIQNVYVFSLEDHFQNDLTSIPGTKNRVRQALYSCQKILLSMGDLARYKEQYSINPSYVHAKKWYEMALQVNPKNGRPFNQLAIISVSQKRPLDIVYYYIRSLMASTPFESVRDSLISLFEEFRKKYDNMLTMTEGSSNEFSQDFDKPDDRSCRNEGSLRREIWIRPDSGATNKRTMSQSNPEEVKKLQLEQILKTPHDQLMKRFFTGYLHCHGMLFSRVGLDKFTDVLRPTLKTFHALLMITPPLFTVAHLLQITAINIFAIENTQLRDSRLESGYRSAAQDLALLLANEFFGHLAEAMVRVFPSCFSYEGPDSFDAEAKQDTSGQQCPRLFLSPLSHFVPAAKVWCDWLLYHSPVWNPPPVSYDVSWVDTWGSVGELSTLMKNVEVPVALDEASADSKRVHLPEDAFLRGYLPVMQGQSQPSYVPSLMPKEMSEDVVRMTRLRLCLAQFLCGVEPPVLKLQKTDQGEILVPVIAVVESEAADDASLPADESGNESVDSSDSCLSDSDEGEVPLGEKMGPGSEDTPLSSTVRLLTRRKRILEKKQRQQRKMEALVQGSVTLEMEIRPRYLVPDTNCFIEKLQIIQRLIASSSYTFMVPLIVLTELDGLSRGVAVEKYGGDVHHAMSVREGAASALHFIQNTKNPRFKCVTSQGSVAPSTMFSLELDSPEDVTNDDKILSCCLHLCSDAVRRRPIVEGVRRVYREVILLTEDRNLRVKAYSRDVPVRELTDFAAWAGIK